MAQDTYKTRTFVELPTKGEGDDLRKPPGSTITSAELAEHGQTEDDVQALLDKGALTTDMAEEVHPDHLPVEVPQASLPKMVEFAKELVDRYGENAPQAIHDVAALDAKAINVSDSQGEVHDEVAR